MNRFRPRGQPSRGGVTLAAFLCVAIASCGGSDLPTGPVDGIERSLLSVTPETITLGALGDTARTTARLVNDSGEVLPGLPVWSSDDPSIVSVGPDGLVTALGPGTAQVAVRVDDLVAYVSVTVVQVPLSIGLDPTAAKLYGPGDTFRATATVLDAGGSTIEGAPIVWTVGDPAVATVDPEGLVTGVAAGATWLRATHDGLSADRDVIVATPADAPSFSSDINPLFRSNGCLSCHGGGGSGGLVLSTDAATSYANLVGVPSTGAPTYLRVERYDSFGSYLIMKLEGRQLSGSSMPLGREPMSDEKISAIRQWIDAGAANNE